MARKAKSNLYRIGKIDQELAEYPGVTTILGLLDKPALRQWAVDCAVDYIAAHGDSGEALEAARQAHRAESTQAMSTGSAVHDLIEHHISEAHDKSTLGEYNDEAQNAFLAFLDWEKKSGIEWLECERAVVEETACYAGTLDAVARYEGEVLVIDFKVAKGIYPEYWQQAAAYAAARAGMSGDYRIETAAGIEMQHYEPIHPEGIGILRLDKVTGMPDFKIKVDADEIAGLQRAFRHLVDYYYESAARRCDNRRTA